MASLQSDFYHGIAPESAYSGGAFPVPATVVRAWEGKAELTQQVTRVAGTGYRPGLRGVRTSRYKSAKFETSGATTTTAASSGMGLLLQAFFGANTALAAIAATAARQSLFTLKGADWLPSYTIQQVIPVLGGNAAAFTFPGMQCAGLEFTAKGGEGVQVKADWVGSGVKRRDIAIDPSIAFPGALEQLTFAGADIKLGSSTLGGTLTAATGTAVAAIAGGINPQTRDITLTLKNGLDTADPNLGGNGAHTRPRALRGGSLETAKGSMTAEFSSAALIDLASTDEDVSIVLTFAGVVEIATGILPLIQFCLPACRLTADVPSDSDGDVITAKVDFEALVPASGEMLQGVYRTLDTVL